MGSLPRKGAGEMATVREGSSGPAAASGRDGLRFGHAHLVGIAGAGMRALADVLIGRGWRLSGSDRSLQSARRLATTAGLAAAEIRLFEGHAADHLPSGTELVVYSDAVPPDNSELREAMRRGIPTCSYFEMAGRLMQQKPCGLAVAGTHGKSTTTAMAAKALIAAGRDPTVLYGATALGHSSGGRAGEGDCVLVEACEYRRNFLHLRPRHAIILGIEPDHFDCYDTPEELEEAFRCFARSIPPDGLILARHDCPATRRITRNLRCRVTTFGIQAEADWSARSLLPRRGRYEFEIFRFGRSVCNVALRVPGRHNVLNALAAAALAWHHGAEADRIARSLGGFRGLHRRFEPLGTWRGVLMLDDYAHHPTEVAATLATVRQWAPRRRVWCVFQPHQASRTERLLEELAWSLKNADRVLVAEIFRAREAPPRPGGISAADLARQTRLHGVVVPAVHRVDQIARLLQTHLAPGDVLITMGAGDIAKIYGRLIEGPPTRRAAG